MSDEKRGTPDDQAMNGALDCSGEYRRGLRQGRLVGLLDALTDCAAVRESFPGGMSERRVGANACFKAIEQLIEEAKRVTTSAPLRVTPEDWAKLYAMKPDLEWVNDLRSTSATAQDICEGCGSSREHVDAEGFMCVHGSMHDWQIRAKPSRLDEDGAAKPLTEIREVFPAGDCRGRTLFHGAGDGYVVRPTPAQIGVTEHGDKVFAVARPTSTKEWTGQEASDYLARGVLPERLRDAQDICGKCGATASEGETCVCDSVAPDRRDEPRPGGGSRYTHPGPDGAFCIYHGTHRCTSCRPDYAIPASVRDALSVGARAACYGSTGAMTFCRVWTAADAKACRCAPCLAQRALADLDETGQKRGDGT